MEAIKHRLKDSYHSILNFLEMIKFEHTIFALPFAYMGMFMAAGGLPKVNQFILISIVFCAARTYAMTLNRILDLRFDALNPRTKERALVTGKVQKKTAYIGVLISLLVLIVCSYLLGPLVLKLLPIALIFLTFYHLTKRFTYFSHFILGITDGLAPLGAWVAIRNSLFSPSDLPGWLLFIIVTFWIAGFDIIYQCQDVAFDKTMGLYSIPSRFGIKNALIIAMLSHAVMFIGLLVFGIFFLQKVPFFITLPIILILLIKEHSMISHRDLSKINVAFFNMNGYIAVLAFIGMIASIFL